MSAALMVGVGLVGGSGAIARFLLDGVVAGRLGRDFPFGTLAVNLLGSFVLGILVGLAVDGDAFRIVGTGLVGSFTTFSMWALASHRLGDDGRLRPGLGNFGLSLLLGVTAAWAGRQLGTTL